MLVIDAQGTVLYASPSVEGVLGYTPEELVGRSGYDLVHPDHLQESIDRFNQSIMKPRPVITGERLLLHKDGSSRWVENVIVNLLSEPSVRAVVMHLRNIAERKRADEALRDSEQRFRDYAEIASDWLWETDLDHRFTMWSAAGLGFFRDFIGKRRWELAADREEEPQKWRAHIADLEAHRPFRGFRYKAARPDGSAVYVSVSGKPVFGATGKFLGYRGVATDITAEMRADQAERALRRAQNELAHVTRVTTMGELAASIAHEVSQPIAAAQNNASAALRFLDRESPDLEEVREALGCVVDNAAHAADIIGRIRGHLKKAPPRKDSLDLNAAIREVIALMRREAAKNKVLVRTNLAERLPLVWGDRVQVQQVVLNLILNAVEAMSRVDESSRELLISTQQTPTDDVLAAVYDSGPGIDPENLEHVFESFYTTKPGGVGIGLSICRSIIEAHGGRLWAGANEPVGAVFQFCLPTKTRTHEVASDGLLRSRAE